MSKSASKTFSVYVDDCDGSEQEVSVSVTAQFDYEEYGADADGNRGVYQWTLNDWTCEEIDGKARNDWDKDFIDKVETEIEKMIYDFHYDL